MLYIWKSVLEMIQQDMEQLRLELELQEAKHE